MKIYTIISFLLLVVAIACKESNQPVIEEVLLQQDSSQQVTLKLPEENKPKEKELKAYKMAWADSLIVQYIRNTKNEFVVMARNDKVPIDWMLDRRERTDTADYLIYEISHSFEGRTIADAWLYIDSLTKTIYEYDVAADSLIRWSK